MASTYTEYEINSMQAMLLVLAHSRSLCHASFGGGRGRFVVARDARPCHGGLQRFERVGVEEEWHDAYECYAAFIVPGFLMKVAGDHDLAEIVADMSKRKCLLCAFLGVGNRMRRLDVGALVGKVDLHEVIVLGIDHALKQQISLDGHGAFPVCDFMDSSDNPKTWELYHNLSSKASELLEILWISPRNFKLKLAPAPCRARCRVAFRRVAGGGSSEKEAA